jgi:Tfp pilus assembly protein PilZ
MDGGEGGIERRKHRRLDFQVEASIEHNEKTACGEIRNISNHGAFVKVDGEFAANEQVLLTVNLLRGSAKLSVTMPGTVARVDPEGIGLTSPHIGTYSLLHLEMLLALNRENPQKLTDELYRYVMGEQGANGVS